MKLTEKICVPCEGNAKPLEKKQIDRLLKQVSGWKVIDNKKIRKEYKFKTYPQTVAFANKIALIAQEEGHHPDMELHYSRLVVEFSTHAIGGLSENDFIMAAKIDV